VLYCLIVLPLKDDYAFIVIWWCLFCLVDVACLFTFVLVMVFKMLASFLVLCVLV